MDERLRILKMIEERTITAEQGEELLAAINMQLPEQQTAIVKSAYDKKLLRIIVDTPAGDNVKVQFPIGAVKKLLKATGKLPIPEVGQEGIDMTGMMEAVSECLDEEIDGDFVNVQSSDGTTVRIYVDN